MSIFGLPGKAIAAAVDAVLADQRERVGEQIHRDGEPAARGAHHRLVVFERVAVLVERTYVTRRLGYFRGFGRSRARRGSEGCAGCSGAG